ncbi:MAG: relaxase/mobilization nuclease domain-containing protein [Myxococcales bacterium]|nr:relaxase/mobilization nuclease domain-containing protein [Myxococcales bacterium]MDD9965625.1 relaxase/mobilization nuclease domain-containing protein [Myxococcales bacterium]
MIVKKIKAKSAPRGSGAKSKAAHITDLTDYLCQEERRGSPAREEEEVLYTGAQGFAWPEKGLQGWQKEMIALASAAVRSKNPITHYMLSWQEGEQPTERQVDEAVGIFMKELGLEGHQVVYGLHRDTDNVHLHLTVNRVHPVTERPVKVNKGWDIEAAHQAIARIEHAQGWRRERRGRYQVDEQSQVVRRTVKRERVPEQVQKQEPAKPSIDGAWLPSARRRVQQRQTPTQSAAPREQGGDPKVIAAAVIREAEGWQQLHEQLAKRGMRYERKGAGALVWLGEQPMKASEVDRGASLGQLQKRLGEYQPAAPQLRVGEPPQRREPGQRARDAEHYSGAKSAQRVAIEQAAPVIREATGWQQLHERLARCGMRYERKGSGAVVWVGNVPVKASAVSREASFPKLERRLGEYVAARGARPAARRPEPMQPRMPRWQEYQEARQAHNEARATARRSLRQRVVRERAVLREAQRKQRSELFAYDWRGKGLLLIAMRVVLAREHKAERAALQRHHQRERRRFSKRHPRYPEYPRWLHNNASPGQLGRLPVNTEDAQGATHANEIGTQIGNANGRATKLPVELRQGERR